MVTQCMTSSSTRHKQEQWRTLFPFENLQLRRRTSALHHWARCGFFHVLDVCVTQVMLQCFHSTVEHQVSSHGTSIEEYQKNSTRYEVRFPKGEPKKSRTIQRKHGIWLFWSVRSAKERKNFMSPDFWKFRRKLRLSPPLHLCDQGKWTTNPRIRINLGLSFSFPAEQTQFQTSFNPLARPRPPALPLQTINKKDSNLARRSDSVDWADD